MVGSDARQRLRRVFATRDDSATGDVYLFEDGLRNFFGKLGLFLQRRLCGVAALADEVTLVGDPRTFLFEYLVLEAEIEERTQLGDALVIHDVELHLGERRGDLVLHDFDLGAVADDLALGCLDLFLAADVDADRGEEFQRAAAGRRLGVAEHHADFFANLVREDAHALGLADDGGETTHGLGHQPGLASHRHVAHLAVELGAGCERGDGVEHDDVDRVGADERLHDVERVLAAVGLGNEEIVELHADDTGVFRVERVLDVDERSEAAFFLRLGDDTEAKGGFARGFRAVDFDDAALGQAADAEREVDGERAGGERLDLHLGRAAEAHDGAFAKLFRDGGQREFDVLFTHVRGGRGSVRLDR